MFFIRKANLEDFKDIASIHFKSWHAAYLNLLPKSYVESQNNLFEKIKMWQEVIAHPHVIVWVAYDANHNNLGFIGYFNNNKCYEITTLYVLPEYQGLGVGTKLMTTSLQAILESNINTSFYLWVLKANINAIHFYEKFGFVYTGENNEEDYKGMQIIDVKMVKNADALPP